MQQSIDTVVIDATARIKSRISRAVQDIIEIGRDLAIVKQHVGHGQFLKWIKTEFAMSEDTAERFMNVANNLADQIPHGCGIFANRSLRAGLAIDHA
jgi:hypothetical protein